MTVPKWMYQQPIAHRGYFNDLRPENSLAAFQKAIDHNFAIEMDVQILGDGSLIVFHDSHLKRMTGYDKALKDVTYQEVKALVLKESQEKIPSFKEFLDFIDGQVPLMIEFKNEGTNNLMEKKAYELLKSYRGDYVIQSFNPKSLYWFKRNASHIVRGQLSYSYKSSKYSFLSRWLLKHTLFNSLTKPDYIIYDIKDLEGPIINRLKKRYPIFSYTAKDKASYDYALSLGMPACFEGFEMNKHTK